MQQILNMVMLPAADIARTRRFYEQGLGWQPHGGQQGRNSVKYLASGVLVTMVEQTYLSSESGLRFGDGGANVVLVSFVQSREEVDRIAREVVTSGGTIISVARDRDGGLYTFYFADPDGNPWEIAYSPR